MRGGTFGWILALSCALGCAETTQDSPQDSPDAAVQQHADTPGDAATPQQSMDAATAALSASGNITFTIKNRTSVPLSLPGGMFGRWLEIGLNHHSLWPANGVQEGELCGADPDELGELPPPGAEVEAGEDHQYVWRANSFVGAMPVPGMSEDYLCAEVEPVPLGRQQFLICARQADVQCSGSGVTFPPRLICASTEVDVTRGDSEAEFVFDETHFPTLNCPEAEEVPN